MLPIFHPKISTSFDFLKLDKIRQNYWKLQVHLDFLNFMVEGHVILTHFKHLLNQIRNQHIIPHYEIK
jgi:hypothetical protein